MPDTNDKSRRGFAAMTPERRRDIASMGGKAQGKTNNTGNFWHDRVRARIAGQKGGRVPRQTRMAASTPEPVKERAQ